ncbi:hypothetical protein DFJ73DRAFT_757226 [Zopfochytrium polystomum]|nr:hypothetical protein DFJ73DRAFT_757226 [Zopfochytrium polystomum]
MTTTLAPSLPHLSLILRRTPPQLQLASLWINCLKTPVRSAPPPAVEHTDNTGDASVDNDEACDTYSVYEPSSPLALPTSPTASEAVSPGNTAPVPTDPTVTVETSNSDNDTNIA